MGNLKSPALKRLDESLFADFPLHELSDEPSKVSSFFLKSRDKGFALKRKAVCVGSVIRCVLAGKDRSSAWITCGGCYVASVESDALVKDILSRLR